MDTSDCSDPLLSEFTGWQVVDTWYIDTALHKQYVEISVKMLGRVQSQVSKVKKKKQCNFIWSSSFRTSDEQMQLQLLYQILPHIWIKYAKN